MKHTYVNGKSMPGIPHIPSLPYEARYSQISLQFENGEGGHFSFFSCFCPTKPGIRKYCIPSIREGGRVEEFFSFSFFCPTRLGIRTYCIPSIREGGRGALVLLFLPLLLLLPLPLPLHLLPKLAFPTLFP